MTRNDAVFKSFLLIISLKEIINKFIFLIKKTKGIAFKSFHDFVFFGVDRLAFYFAFFIA